MHIFNIYESVLKLKLVFHEQEENLNKQSTGWACGTKTIK